MAQTVLFKQEGQHIFDYTNVYDPDVHGSDPNASGKIIPAVRSMVIDNRTSETKVYLVKSVDPTTYKVTYMDFPYEVIDRKSMILNYGNDVFMLYFDKRSNPARLTVDAKMVLFGSNITMYKLVKDGVVISRVLRTNDQGVEYETSTVDIVEVTDKYVDGVRRCNTCYSSVVLHNGDLVTLELYDSTGLMVAEVELVAREATILNTISGTLNPIISFDATSNQMNADNTDFDWYLIKGQSKENLSVYPLITFADGTSYVVQVDDSTCFMYGFEDIDTNNSGTTYPIIIKYYVDARYPISDALVSNNAGTKHVLSCQKRLKVIDKPTGMISKISLVPVWKEANSEYDFHFYAYNENRNGIVDITDRVIGRNAAGKQVFKSGVLTNGSVNFGLFDVKQTFTITPPAIAIDGYEHSYSQTFVVILRNPNSQNVERWNIINPDNQDEVYGDNNATYNAPMVYYDPGAETHFFSTDLYRDVETFVDTFYTKASPPALSHLGESIAPYPTHFRFRDLSANILLSQAIEVSRYAAGFNLNNFGLDTPVTSGTVIMEFLYRVGGSEAAILYGVPVLVKTVESGSYIG